MNYRLRKLVYLLSEDARISTKTVSRELNISQQSASYLMQSLISKKIVQKYLTIIDPAKFGFINIMCTYNFKNFSRKEINKLTGELSAENYVVTVEEVSRGADLLIEYSVPNLSFFNKLQREIIHKNRDMIYLKETFVVIVKHKYDRKYLVKTPSFDEIVLCGDRDVILLNESQKKILAKLRTDARIPLIKIADEVKLDSKTVKNIKNNLESKKVIRKYSIKLNYEVAQIKRSYLFLQPDYIDPNKLDKILNFVKKHKNVLEAIKLIGDFELMLVIEEIELSEKIIKDIRENFDIIDYKIINSDKLIKESSIPYEI